MRQMADLAAGWSRSDPQALPAARADNTTLRRGCRPHLVCLREVASFQTHHIQQPASEMLCGQVSLGKRLSGIRGKMGKKTRMASFRGREAERLSLVSLHKPAFPAHRATQPGWCLGKGWQPLCPCAHPASHAQAATPCPPQHDRSRGREKERKLNMRCCSRRLQKEPPQACAPLFHGALGTAASAPGIEPA